MFYTPFVWVFGWLFILDGLTPIGGQYQPLSYIGMIAVILSMPLTWVLIIVGAIGYFMGGDD